MKQRSVTLNANLGSAFLKEAVRYTAMILRFFFWNNVFKPTMAPLIPAGPTVPRSPEGPYKKITVIRGVLLIFCIIRSQLFKEWTTLSSEQIIVQ